MKELFEYIKARIVAQVTEIKTITIWNNQLRSTNVDLNGKTIRYPALFIEFITENVSNYSMGIKDITLTVRFRMAKEGYKFERLDTFDFADRLDAAIQLMAPTVLSGLTFTTFQEVLTEFDEDHDNVDEPYKDFRTRYRYTNSYQRSTDLQTAVITTTPVTITPP